MRIVEYIKTPLIAALGVAAGLAVAGPVAAFDGVAAAPGEHPDPLEAFRTGARAYYSGDKAAALEALSIAADNGHAAAQWKLGRMYADGDGVPENDAKAFEYFSQVANEYADASPNNPDSRFAASSFVALGSYYLTGIRDSAVRPNVERAKQMFSYAASYFGDPDAQYNLARLYLDGDDHDSDSMQAARWLKLAAQKNHLQAQVLLGELLFAGDRLPMRRPVAGLMWLTIAREQAGPADHDWVSEKQEQAFSAASEEERRSAVELASTWLKREVASK